MRQTWLDLLLTPIRDRLVNRANLRKVLVNTIWLFADRVLAMVVSFIIGAWVARHLGQAQWGLLNYAASFTSLFLIASTLGLDNIAIRALVRDDQSQEAVLGTTFALRVLAGSIAFVLVLLIAWQIEAESTIRLLVLIAALQLFIEPFKTLDLWFQSQIASKYTVWAQNTSLFISSALKVIFILNGMSVIAFGWTTLIYHAVIAVGLLLAFTRTGPVIRTWQVDWRIARRLLRDSWPVIIASVAHIIYLKFDQVMLENMVGAAAVGTYAAAVRLSELLHFIPNALALSLYPTIIRTEQAYSQEVYAKRLQAFYDFMAVLGYGVVIGITLFSEPLILVLFGPEYAGAVPILRLHIWAFLFYMVIVVRDRWALAENLTGFLMWSNVLGAVVNVGLNFVLIPRYSGMGAALANVIAYAVVGYGSFVLSRRTWPLLGVVGRALLAPLRLRAVCRSVWDGLA